MRWNFRKTLLRLLLFFLLVLIITQVLTLVGSPENKQPPWGRSFADVPVVDADEDSVRQRMIHADVPDETNRRRRAPVRAPLVGSVRLKQPVPTAHVLQNRMPGLNAPASVSRPPMDLGTALLTGRWPLGGPSNRVYYDPMHDHDDRIASQLVHVSHEAIAAQKSGQLKTIFVHSMGSWVKPGQATFLEQKCPVNSCSATSGMGDLNTADAVLFSQGTTQLAHEAVRRNVPRSQIWIMFLLESPYHTPGLRANAGVFNWTATYRHDSTIVAPYEKFVQYNRSVPFLGQKRNYAAGKTKKVAWFVSNCGARNGRSGIAHALQKYIDVDIYGGCGPLRCPRSEHERCFQLLNTDYKFYLAFENSNCRDYITEKFFVNGLQHDVIPIVMGAHPDDYRRAAPPHSFIHVDDFGSIKELANYLHKLDQNDHLYNEYFAWKGTGELINTYFWCRVCAMLHVPHESVVDDVDDWWRGERVCRVDSWRTGFQIN